MSYTLKSVSFPGDNFLQLLGVDDAGVIVGYHGEDVGMGGSNPNVGETLLPPYQITQFTPLFPAAPQTQAIGINNSGTVVGFYADGLGATAIQHGFIDQNGTFAIVDDFPGGTAEPINNLLGVNNSGTEVGFYQDAGGDQHAYVVTGGSITGVVANVGTFTGGTITDLVVMNGTVGVVDSTATGVNNEGTVVGFFTDLNGVSAGFEETSPGNFTTVVVPGATITQVLGINDAGVMVGDFTDSSGVMHGFVDNNGTFTTIDGPGATATTLNGINDFGEVTGFYTDASNDTVGLVGLPVGGTISLVTLDLGTTGGLYMVQGTANAEAGVITGTGALTIEAAPGSSGPAAAAFTASSTAYAAPVTLRGVTVDVAASAALGTGGIDFAAGVASTLKLESAAMPFGNTISGFAFGDTIDLVGVTTTVDAATVAAGGTLTIPGTAVTLNFDTADTPAGAILTLGPDGGSGTDIMMNAPHQFAAATVNFTGDVFTQLLGVNNAGTVAGYHGVGTTVEPNVGLLLPPPNLPADFVVDNFPTGAVQTQVVAINNSDMTAGFYVDAGGINHGFIDNAGTFSTVDDLPGGTVEPINQLLSINNSGEAAGYYQDASGDQHPYVVSQGTFTTIDPPGISATVGGQATAINDAGVIAGFFTNTGGTQLGFVDNAGTFTTVDVPNSMSTQVLGMNNAGVMVGDFVDAGGVMHGFVDDQGVFTTIDGPGAVSTLLNGINDFDQVAGFYNVDGTTTTDNGLILTANGNKAAPLTLGSIDLASDGGLYSVLGDNNTIAGPISGASTLALQAAAGSVGPDSVTITSSGNSFAATSLGGVTLDVAASGGLGSGPVTFTQAPALLTIGAPIAFTNTLEDFNAGDVIDLNGILSTAGAATLTAGGTLSIPELSGSLDLTFGGAAAGTVFALNRDASGNGTLVTLARDYTLLVRGDPGDPTFNQLLSIGNSGTITGYFGSGSTSDPNVGRLLAPPYGSGDFTTLNATGQAQTQVTALNTTGTAVGFYADAANDMNSGFIENAGTFVTVADTPVNGVVVNQLLGENNLGVAAGYWQDPTATNGVFLQHGYTVSGGVDTGGTLTGATFTPIVPTGAISEQATGVNDSGEVVGFFTDDTAAAGVHGFTDIGGVFTTIDVPGATTTQVLGVNNAGVVVGDFIDTLGNMHGFVDDHGAFTTIDGPNTTMTTVNGINDFNEIVGFDVDSTSGFTTGFIGTPNGGGGFTNVVAGPVTLGAGGGLEYLQGTNNIVAAEITGSGALSLELAPGATSASVTLSGSSSDGGGMTIGSGITVDLAAAGAGTTGNVQFAGAGDLIVETADAAFANPITSFTPGATVDLRGVLTSASNATVSAGGVLAIPVTGGGTQDLSLPNNANQVLALTPDGDGGTDVLACYREGTRLLTPAGEIAIEALRAGDAVIALSGQAASVRRVKWIGRSTVDLDRHPRPERATPVRVRAGAFAPGMPHRDLLLSPDHAVRLCDAAGEALVPIRLLVNGASIVREPASGVVTYLHVELDRHSLVLAEGLPAESYLDTGNRADFDNGGVMRSLHPAFDARSWDERAVAVLLLGGSRVQAEHARLCATARELGLGMTADPALEVTAEGRLLASERLDDGGIRYRLPDGAGTVRLRSRLAVVGGDDRALGVAIRSLALDGKPIALDSGRFGAGWHAPEPSLRWTDGDALIDVGGARTLVLKVALIPHYRDKAG